MEPPKNPCTTKINSTEVGLAPTKYRAMTNTKASRTFLIKVVQYRAWYENELTRNKIKLICPNNGTDRTFSSSGVLAPKNGYRNVRKNPRRPVKQIRSKIRAEYFSTLEKINVTTGYEINISIGKA